MVKSLAAKSPPHIDIPSRMNGVWEDVLGLPKDLVPTNKSCPPEPPLSRWK